MIVAGVMSGTSADGVDVALVRIEARSPTSFKLLGHAEYPYPRKVRAAVLAAMNAPQASVADLSRLNFLLGELYAETVLATERQVRVKVDLVGCHGQTLYHQGEPQTGSHVADRRGSDHRGESRSARGFGFSSVRYGGRR